MNYSEILGSVLILSLYVIGWFLVTINNTDSGKLCDELVKDGITHSDNIEFLAGRRFEIALIIGALWPFYYAFLWGSNIGVNIYDNFIASKDNEDRIASWFV